MSGVHPFLDDAFLFDWSRLRPEQVEPDLREALRRARAAIDAFKALPPARLTYDEVLLGFERATRELSRAWGLVTHLDAVMNSEPLRKAHNALLPEVTAFFTSLTLDPQVWSVIRDYSRTPEAAALTGVRRRFLEETVADFVENGADLPPERKERLAAINAELAARTQKYSENVLDSTNAWDLFVTDASRLRGLPESSLASARQSATAKGRPEAWRFTLHAPSVFPVLEYAEDDALRRECWEALGQVGLKSPWDNTALVGEILALRHEKARLLGKQHFADFTTARRMAGSGARALAFIEDLGRRVRPRFRQETEELEAFRAARTGETKRHLHPWEFALWSERMRKERHGFDDEALRPWFPVDGVIAGMFRLFGDLFGIQVAGRDTVHVDPVTGQSTVIRAAEPRIEAAPVPVWHPEVRFYEVRDGARHLGSFYTDWFPRESKRGGAWMNFLRTGGPRPDGSFAPHLGLMCGNFTPPVGGGQALLTHDEVTTVFHEFGHLLHHVLSEVEVESLSGVRVAWDFVELPSQILENWCWEREALDLDLHLRAEELKGRDLDDHWNNDFAEWQAPTTRRLPAMARRFNHLFSDATGYAAGYYSYKWAEALEADAFTRFLKEGVLNPRTGRELRTRILAKGNSEPAAQLFRDFVGRDLDPEALLVRDGLA